MGDLETLGAESAGVGNTLLELLWLRSDEGYVGGWCVWRKRQTGNVARK